MIFKKTRLVNLIENTKQWPKNLLIIQIAKFGEFLRSYFFITKCVRDKSITPLDSPHHTDLRKNAKSKFPGLAELSTGLRATSMKTNDLNQTSSLSFVMKLRAQISRMGSHFLGCKKQSLYFSLCGQLLFIIRCKTKVYLPQILWFTHPTFFKRSSNFPTQF